MKNIRRIVLGMCLLIGMVCGNTVIVQADNASTKTIGDYVCTWYPGTTTTDIVKYNGTDANVTIPAELEGRKVIEISNRAFENCTCLENVTISEGIERMWDGVFSGCSNLKSVSIPNSVKEIYSQIFSGCSSLTEITIPEGISKLSFDLFKNCTSLQKVTLPKQSLTTIESSVFSGCTQLKEIEIPDSVTEIEREAFAGCSSLTTVAVSDNLESIPAGVFSGCTSLTEITIPEKVTLLGREAFRQCSSLNNITIPKDITTIGDSAFAECTALEHVDIMEGVKSIDHGMFFKCTNLTSVSIPNSVTEIGSSAFSCCERLNHVQLPKNLQKIGESAFYNCESLQSIVIPDSVVDIGGYAFGNCTSLQNITIPEGVTNISQYMFLLCESLQEVTLPESVKSIGDSAFSCCDSLLDIEFPDSLESIGDAVFGYGTNMSRVVYTNPGSYAEWWLNKNMQPSYQRIYSVGYILDEENCRVKVLAKEDSPTVEYRNPIGKDAEEYTIPDTVTIGKDTYYVTSIADNAFAECGNVKKVTLGQNVEQIQPDAFAGVAEEEGDLELVIPEELEDISNIGITNISNVNNLTINVAEGSKAEIYLQQNTTIHYHTYPSTQTPEQDKKDDGKKDAAVVNAAADNQPTPVVGQIYVVGNANYKVLSSDQTVFTGVVNKKMKTLKIPDTVTINGRLYRVTAIEKQAMKGCAKLQTVVIGNQVTAIGEKAFGNCKKLQKVTIGSGVTTIGKGAFGGDKKLKRMIFRGTKLKKVGRKALKGVPKRIRITAPKKCVQKYKKLLNTAK